MNVVVYIYVFLVSGILYVDSGVVVFCFFFIYFGEKKVILIYWLFGLKRKGKLF